MAQMVRSMKMPIHTDHPKHLFISVQNQGYPDAISQEMGLTKPSKKQGMHANRMSS